MNDEKRRPSSLAHRLARRLPVRVKSALRKLLRRAAKPSKSSGSPRAPVLTVVVVAHNAEPYLSECLKRLRSQTLNRIEVLVVDDGSTDGTVDVAQQVAAEDRRFQILMRPRLGLTASRNEGAQIARGEFLAFVDATDTVPRNAYASLVGSLRRTGSDFAVGSVRTVIRGRRRRPAWAVMTEALGRPAHTLGEFPLAMGDTFATNRVFRRSFWNADVGGFPSAADGEAFAIVRATLQARQFAFVRTVSCMQHTRLDPGTLLPPPLEENELESRLEWHRTTWQLVRDAADPSISGSWLGSLIDGDLGDFAADAHRADALYRERLHEAAQEFLAMADDTVWPHVRVERKLCLWLVASRRWTDLEQLTHHFGIYGSIPRIEVREGRVHAVAEELPHIADAPRECRELADSQTAFSGCIERVAWDGDRLELHGWAFIRGVDLVTHPPRLTASLIEPETGLSHSCEVTQDHKEVANRWAMFRYQDVAPGGFVISIDTERIGRAPGSWQLRLTVQAGDLERTGPVRAVVAGGPRTMMSPRNMQRTDDQNRVVPKLHPEEGFLLHVRPERIQALWLATAGAGKVTGALRVVDPQLGGLSSVAAVSHLSRVMADLIESGTDGIKHFELDLPVGADGAVDWQLRAVDWSHREHRVSWPIEAEYGSRVGGGVRKACWRRSATGYCDLATDWAAAEGKFLAIRGEELSIDLRLIGLAVSDCAGARLSGSLGEVSVRLVESVVDGVRLVFPLRTARWGQPELPLPSGSYRIVLTSERHVLCSEELVDLLPQEGLSTYHSYRFARTGSAELVIHLSAPLTDAERSRVAQDRLGTWYQQSSFTPTESVLFQSYRGEFASDSQLALHSELRNWRPDLELIWGVKDLSVAVPEGGRALLIESREWYAALGGSRYLCRNIDFERYFRKRPHPLYLQTFHGYRFKSMGASLWRAQGRPASVVALECSRRIEAWDAIVVPESFCVDLYRREYRYSGEALVTGYPRNDALLSKRVELTRSRVLEQLGIEPDRILVLYAPTWRDTVATSPWTAKMFDGLDLGQLAEELGDGYAVLLRGHNYNLREGLSPTEGHVWDVSAYPEINDLLLAADVAVLDYSSIRLDWLITGKPVMFYVPDLENYLSSRRVLFDYAPTAPGPQLATTAGVAEALLDLGSVASDYAAARELFNKEFNRLHDGRATERVINAFF